MLIRLVRHPVILGLFASFLVIAGWKIWHLFFHGVPFPRSEFTRLIHHLFRAEEEVRHEAEAAV